MSALMVSLKMHHLIKGALELIEIITNIFLQQDFGVILLEKVIKMISCQGC